LGGILISAYFPDFASDQNEFLREFIDEDYIAFLGVILSITLASLAQLYLSLSNNWRERLGETAFSELARELRNTAAFLIGIFASGLALVIAKPMLSLNAHWEAAINFSAIWLLCFYLLILVDVTFSIFDL
jgi:hypothetical protein